MDELRARLTERYREPHRHYHDVRHLQDVLDTVDELTDDAADEEAVRWAAWFHDAVYDVRRDDNEEQSARLAVEELRALGLPTELVDEVARLVRLTATHRPADADHNGTVLCDADLRILSTDPSRYTEYIEGVRSEYGHLSDEQFREGRSAVLRRLLGSDRLYRTDSAHARWEDRARANLTNELHRLESRA